MNGLSKLPLWSHPTTWVVVDDEERFLASFKAYLPKNQPVVMFESPLDALKRLTQSQIEAFSIEESLGDDEDVVVHFSLDSICRFLLREDRFSQVSVVVSDYAMPDINGIELFEELRNPHIKRILLTGVADEKLAVAAFNDGLIDRFVLKGDPHAIEKVEAYSKLLERQRFIQLQGDVYKHVKACQALFDNEEFVKFIDTIIVRRKFVEHYFTTDPQGILFADANGNANLLHLAEASDVRSADDFQAGGVPREIRDLSTRAQLAVELFEPMSTTSIADYDWSFNTMEVEPVPGNGEWVMGMHTSPPLDVDFDPELHSLTAFIRGL